MGKQEKKDTLEPGVYVSRTNEPEKVMAFIGNYEAQLNPAGALAIIELTPDVGNLNDGKDIPVIRRFIAEGVWSDVVVV